MHRQTVDAPYRVPPVDERIDEPEPLPTDPTRPAGTVSALIESLRAFGDRLLTLVALEGTQAGISLAFMLSFAVAAAVLVITAWLALIACVVVALVEYDVVGWPWALVIAALLSFAGAAGLVVLLIQRSKDLLFTATRRQLRGENARVNNNERTQA